MFGRRAIFWHALCQVWHNGRQFYLIGGVVLKLKRRQFLKLAGAAGTGLALSKLGFDVQPIEAASQECRVLSAREYTSVCTFCSCGCGMICHVKNGKLINLEGDPDHIINEGALC